MVAKCTDAILGLGDIEGQKVLERCAEGCEEVSVGAKGGRATELRAKVINV
jgi:hypothetical protein